MLFCSGTVLIIALTCVVNRHVCAGKERPGKLADLVNGGENSVANKASEIDNGSARQATEQMTAEEELPPKVVHRWADEKLNEIKRLYDTLAEMRSGETDANDDDDERERTSKERQSLQKRKFYAWSSGKRIRDKKAGFRDNYAFNILRKLDKLSGNNMVASKRAIVEGSIRDGKRFYSWNQQGKRNRSGSQTIVQENSAAGFPRDRKFYAWSGR